MTFIFNLWYIGSMNNKENEYKGQAGKAGKYTANGFIPSCTPNKKDSRNSGYLWTVIIALPVIAIFVYMILNSH